MIESAIEFVTSLSVEQLAISVLGAVGLGWVAVRRVVAWIRGVIFRFAIRKAVALGIIGTGAGDVILDLGIINSIRTLIGL